MAQRFLHHGLQVYHLAVEFYGKLSILAASLPWRHIHLSDQMLRGGASIGLNLAEGSHEFSKPEKRRFYRIALRSAGETAAALELIRSAGLADPAVIDARLAELDRIIAMLTRLVNS